MNTIRPGYTDSEMWLSRPGPERDDLRRRVAEKILEWDSSRFFGAGDVTITAKVGVGSDADCTNNSRTVEEAVLVRDTGAGVAQRLKN